MDKGKAEILGRIRLWLGLFMVGLALSGITAFPLVHELRLLDSWIGEGTDMAKHLPELARWISRVHAGLEETALEFPFIAYGSDWLAFAHIVLAISFWGALRDPVRNIWGIEFGMIACVATFPLAFICGPIRGIPIYWILIDCSFGTVGLVPLMLARRGALRLAAMEDRVGATGRSVASDAASR